MSFALGGFSSLNTNAFPAASIRHPRASAAARTPRRHQKRPRRLRVQRRVRLLRARRDLVPHGLRERVHERRVSGAGAVSFAPDAPVRALHESRLQRHGKVHVRRVKDRVVAGAELGLDVELRDAVLHEQAEEVQAGDERLAVGLGGIAARSA